jgi:DNA-directed RNA polymerase subunit omega
LAPIGPRSLHSIGDDKLLDAASKRSTLSPSPKEQEITLREDYLQAAQKAIPDGNILVNVVSRRVKQLKSTHRPLVESLEKLSPEDIALREIIEGKISYELGTE